MEEILSAWACHIDGHEACLYIISSTDAASRIFAVFQRQVVAGRYDGSCLCD